MSLTNAVCAAQGAMPAAVGARQTAAQYLKVSSPHVVMFSRALHRIPQGSLFVLQWRTGGCKFEYIAHDFLCPAQAHEGIEQLKLNLKKEHDLKVDWMTAVFCTVRLLYLTATKNLHARSI